MKFWVKIPNAQGEAVNVELSPFDNMTPCKAHKDGF